MEFSLFDAELEAMQSLNNLVELAKECRRLHERAQMPMPELLRRMFAMNDSAGRKAVQISPPETPPRPLEAESNWISISAKEALPTSLVAAILREAKGRLMQPKDIISAVHSIRPEIPDGTIYNLGKRLDGTSIKRSGEGWELLVTENAPVLEGNLIWGVPEFFSKQELAAHRRDAIIHLLGLYSTGQQVNQVIEMLGSCPWVKAPINKDLVQDDIDYLSKEGKIKRRGNTKKWELVTS